MRKFLPGPFPGSLGQSGQQLLNGHRVHVGRLPPVRTTERRTDHSLGQLRSTRIVFEIDRASNEAERRGDYPPTHETAWRLW
ncbi:hypothetical protein GCM10010341_88210 [Streptomyces noursei]|nr:hypothetical protein GCM10010341_88210 [Streptomyces noursei]